MQTQRIRFFAAFLLALVGPGFASTVSALPQEDAAQHSHGAGDSHGDHDHDHAHAKRSFAYTDEMLELAGSLPVQDGGRIKPLSTLAGFKLLTINGKRSLNVEGLAPEKKLDPTGWLLDLMLFPGQAGHYECFRIDNAEILTAIGVKTKEKRRGWYCFEELIKGVDELRTKVDIARRKDPKNRSLVETQYMKLWADLSSYDQLATSLAFTKTQLPLRGNPVVAELFAEERPGLAVALEQAAGLREAFSTNQESEEARLALMQLVDALDAARQRNWNGLGLFPPAADAVGEGDGPAAWLDVGQLTEVALTATPDAMNMVEALAKLEAVDANKEDPVAFTAALGELNQAMKSRAEARGEYAKIGMERSFYKADYFYRSLILFGLAFLACAVGWLLPRSSVIGKVIWVLALGAEGLLITGIVLRCILRSRPPVSTLYETILFISATGVLVALIAEWINRKRMALSVAVVLGMFGMFLAGRYELREAATAGDTMPSLVAVLDTNFWLATHVTSITLGYAAGLLASAMGHCWLVLWALGKKRSNPKLMRDVERMMYGVLCFALLFSVVGTILGGVWANDSWGRFWGWDPKENGALLICLSQLAILHGRLGGMLKGLSLVLATIFGGMIVAFSWWHVNLLGVGLHSYGFTDGVHGLLRLFYSVEGGIILLAMLASIVVSRTSGGAPKPA